MGLMALNFATLNVRGLRDPSKCAHLLGELSNLSVSCCSVRDSLYFHCGLSGAGEGLCYPFSIQQP